MVSAFGTQRCFCRSLGLLVCFHNCRLHLIPYYKVKVFLPAIMKVSELASEAGVNPQTVRYYEREGLLPEPERTGSGYRNYDVTALHRLRFIVDAKEIGFTLKQIRQLLGLDPDAPQSCGCVQEMVTERLDELEQRLATMRRMRKQLQKLHTLCSEKPANSACPVLEALDAK